MSRNVIQIVPSADRREDERTHTFSEFVDHPNLILLGDPGAGKTHLFEEAASAEGARLLNARAFLVTPPTKMMGQSLFIDGLDERRAGRGDRDTVDRIVEKLFQVNPLRLRISCRAADWLGKSDLAALEPYFGKTGQPTVLLLEKLSLGEQLTVLSAQGAAEGAAEAFLAEVRERGLDEFLWNPQNLIMLWKAVEAGSWVATRKELFDLSVNLMLQESNEEHARTGGGVYSAAELRQAAGAICAARVISDVEAIGLSEREDNSEIPSYRSLSLAPPEKVLAALGRRAFRSGPIPESVDYVHRTTAEYLGAEFLATRVRAGLPFGRVAALMGIDGHPASELRGLHAWLVVHLPENAGQLIEADPYGVLTYGDAASLSSSDCARLLRELGRLSESDPWFRSDDRGSQAIATLARPDMVAEFRAVLRDPAAGFGVRSIVVDALWLGTRLPVMVPDLQTVLATQAVSYRERQHALFALLRLGPAGRAAVRSAAQIFDDSISDLRLRAEVLEKLYADPFGASDVAELVKDILAAGERVPGGTLWPLADCIPVSDLPDILDTIELPGKLAVPVARSWEAGTFFTRALCRVWTESDEFDAARALEWLEKRSTLEGAYGAGRSEGLAEAIKGSPERAQAVARCFVESLPTSDWRWLALSRFRDLVQFDFPPSDLLSIIVEKLESSSYRTDDESTMYEVAFSLTFQISSSGAENFFVKLYNLSNNMPSLLSARDKATRCLLSDGYFDRPLLKKNQANDGFGEIRRNFERDVNEIRSGLNIDWLSYIAHLYFGLFHDVDHDATPHDRIVATLGGANAESAIVSLRRSLFRSDVPRFDEIIALARQDKKNSWWLSLIAGLNERWIEGNLDDVPSTLVEALLAFDAMNPTFERKDGQFRRRMYPWRAAFLEAHPENANRVLVEVARLNLSRGDEHISGLNDILSEASLQQYRVDTVIELAREFPSMNIYRLGDLLGIARESPIQLRELAEAVLSGPGTIGSAQRDLWLVEAYFLDPNVYESEVESRAREHCGLVFDLRDRWSGRGSSSLELPVSVLEFMARLTGSVFRNESYPSEGWSGDTNSWDAAEFCRNVINAFSGLPSEAATEALMRLEADPALISYRSHAQHALANQRRRRRDAEYNRPDWRKTIRVLANKSPVDVSDLHALALSHLVELRDRIIHENTDIYKEFWNVSSYGSIDIPRPEELCRDTLIQMIRPKLFPLRITVEPEMHMVGDRRADISIAMPGLKILCELKRDYHDEVWTAIEGQLDRFYAHDPEAKGYGIYCVFWFGDKRSPRTIRSPPSGLARPQSANEMERMLIDMCPSEIRHRIGVVVIDVSGPA